MKHHSVCFSLRAASVLLAVAFTCPAAMADWDPVMEAKEQAAREAEARQAAERERQNQALKSQAEAKYYRGVLGAQAAGKSDAEVIRMGREWKARTERQAGAAQADYTARFGAQGERIGAAGARAERQAPARQAQAENAIRQASGGKYQRMEDLANLSDAELEALARNAAGQGPAQRAKP